MAKTILLADDSVTIQKVVELTFMDEDYQVVAVSDGIAALERLEEVAPDLVIADVHMPQADGYEVCRQTKASHPEIPVLLLVGTFEQFDEDQASEAGADGHLKKPFDSQDLLSQVESLIVRAEEAPAPSAAVSTAEGEPAKAGDVFELEEASPAGDLEPPPLVGGVAEADLDGAQAAEPVSAFDLAPEPEAAPEAEPSPFEVPPFGGPESTETAAIALEAPSLEAPEDSEDRTETGESTRVEPPFAAAEPEREPAPEPSAAAEPEPEAAAEAEPDAGAAAGNGSGALSDEDVERIAKRVAELVGEQTVREVAWEVVPDLAEVIIKERIRELESQVE